MTETTDKQALDEKPEEICYHIHIDLTPVSGRVTCKDCGLVLFENHHPDCCCNRCSFGVDER